MGRLYARLATLLQSVVILTALLVYVAAHPVTVQLLAQKLLPPLGITYRRIHGNLLTGITLDDAVYERAFRARRLTVRYQLFKLLTPRPTIDTIALQHGQFWPDRLPKSKKSDQNGSLPPLPPVLLHHLRLRGLTIYTPKPVTLDLNAKDLRWRGESLKVPTTRLTLHTPWASGRFRGRFDMKSPQAWQADFKAEISPAAEYLNLARRYASPIPDTLSLSLHADPQAVTLRPRPIASLKVTDANTTIRGLRTRIVYHLKKDYLEADTRFDLDAYGIQAQCRDRLIVTANLAFMSDLKADILTSPYPLPSNHLEMAASGAADALVAHLNLAPYRLDLYSTDYRKFALHLKAKPHSLSYIPHLPDPLKHERIAIEANALLDTTPPGLKSTIRLESGDTEGRMEVTYKKGDLLVASILEPKGSNPGIWENLPAPLRKPLYLYLYVSKQSKIFNATTQEAQITLFQKRRAIDGWADVAGMIDMDVKGQVIPRKGVRLNLHTHLDSLQALLHRMSVSQGRRFDAEIDTRIHLNIARRLRVRYDITIPWYLYNPDSTHAYYGLDSKVEGEIQNRTLIISRYDLGIMNRRFVQTRPSIVRFNPDGSVKIVRFALLDHGLLTGLIHPGKSEASLHIGGKKIHYKGPEGDLTFHADIDIKATKNLNDVEGELKLLEGTIRYMPKKSYTVNDEDIVVIQDIKEPSHTQTVIDLHIEADRPIHYRTKMVKADFKPDITLWKEAGKPLVLLGIVRIQKGSIDVEDKHFIIEPSEIYFAGNWPIDPWLDLHIRYDLDFNIFYIYVSHTLSDPVFYFSSQPPMSQNDIMSYILFGSPATGAFKSDAEGNSIGMMLLSAGLKNAIGSATGIKFDTFNILHTDDGRMGVEIGKRLGHGFRILYRNDDISSFIIQYALSRSVRVEVDVKETGQGINILYFKDFKGPKRLNALWHRP